MCLATFIIFVAVFLQSLQLDLHVLLFPLLAGLDPPSDKHHLSTKSPFPLPLLVALPSFLLSLFQHSWLPTHAACRRSD
jgi:hypothetical protein